MQPGERDVRTEKRRWRRADWCQAKRRERQRIKRSVETSGVSRLHGFVEPPCYYTDYIFKCAYSGCSPLTLLPGSFFASRFSSFTAPATSTIRHVLSIFLHLYGFYDTFVALSLPRCHISRNPSRLLYLSQTRCSDLRAGMRRTNDSRRLTTKFQRVSVHFHLSFVCVSAQRVSEFLKRHGGRCRDSLTMRR